MPPRFFRVIRAYGVAALGPVSLALCFISGSEYIGYFVFSINSACSLVATGSSYKVR